ncbi:MAG: hypothetical protein GQ538_09860 [Xanthomonadales bacterium]|nr:hypothetical protein [Xanthomonadales bacterium]
MQNKNSITKMVLELVLQVALVVMAVAIVVIDAETIEHGRSEYSITEFTHSFFILVSALLFGLTAIYNSHERGFLLLVMGLFITMLIRENDAFLDAIQHGFWVYPAVVATLVSIFCARKCTGTVKQAMLAYMESKKFAYITLGLVIIVVFSRTFGSGNLWREVMGDDYSTLYKSVIQEGIELLGYTFVLYGSILVWFKAFRGKSLNK